MAGTFTKLQYHVVFSTKGRRRFITDALRPRLYEYLGGIIRGQNGVLDAIGGTADHVHLFVRWRPDGALSGLVRDVKSNASGWIHRTVPDPADFAWQDGFAAFTVSESQSDKVRAYIRGQEGHHRERDFKAELRTLLEAHGVEFEETYIWR